MNNGMDALLVTTQAFIILVGILFVWFQARMAKGMCVLAGEVTVLNENICKLLRDKDKKEE